MDEHCEGTEPPWEDLADEEINVMNQPQDVMSPVEDDLPYEEVGNLNQPCVAMQSAGEEIGDILMKGSDVKTYSDV